MENTNTSTNQQIESVSALLESLKTKSAVIRYLASLGMKRGDIVRHFKASGYDIRYQHVRNVLITPIKKA